MKILSFIIPSYNSEKYLDNCITSFLDKGCIDKLDIIIVNDGSIDNTPEIASKYCSMYPNSIRLFNQENKGHGGAINSGCELAVGKYLKVIDADDTIVTENLSSFLTFLEENESEVVITHHYTNDIVTGEVKRWMAYPKEFNKNYTLSEVVSNWNDFARSITFHGITYLTSFYKSHSYKLTEKVFYEDHEFSTFPCCYARSVICADIFLYKYRIGDVNQSVADEQRVKRLSHVEAVLNRFVCEFANLQGVECTEQFVSIKAKILLISYLTTVMLCFKDKASGRRYAKQMMLNMKQKMPLTYKQAKKQYIAFYLLNLLCISKSTLDKLLNSRAYHFLKGTHRFE